MSHFLAVFCGLFFPSFLPFFFLIWKLLLSKLSPILNAVWLHELEGCTLRSFVNNKYLLRPPPARSCQRALSNRSVGFCRDEAWQNQALFLRLFITRFTHRAAALAR